VELGLATFADVSPGADAGRAAQRLRELLEEIELADQLGLEVFGVGEHHRPDYAVSAPAVVLAAAAARTESIRLSSAVTVLSSADPVRVFQDFATVDLLSGGRAEIMAGRGSFIESFPLFGYDLDDYDELFAEKLELLLALRESERVSWSGKHRAALRDVGVYPRPLQQPLPVWIAVGGSPGSVARAGALGLPLMLAIIGGQPARFAPLIDLYREAAKQGNAEQGNAERGKAPGQEGSGASGSNRSELAVGINSHAYVAETSQRAGDEFFPHYSRMMNRIGRERGWSPMTREQFDAGCAPEGWLLVGSPQEVAEKILAEYELFGNDRFLAQISVGTLPHEQAMHATELFGSEVAPIVRKALKHGQGRAPADSARGASTGAETG
jgi:alkanesulfonate monooxygenase SsuD/methylene tetrahydromethanopterin reductase-like flavin-dependent oxidoreductase (luciferase family)